jgi:hypothetical protein
MPITHIVAAGDCFVSLAAQYGFRDPRSLYDHPANADLKAKRSELTQLVPGDHVVVPEKARNEFPSATGKRHTFKVRRPPVLLELVLKVDDEPLKNVAYRLVVEGETSTGTTDGDGRVRATISATAVRARVELDDPPLTYNLAIGSLEPPTTLAGAAARIANLGITANAVDTTDPDAAAGALRAFQKYADLDPSGELDGATTGRLKSLHGG